MFTGLHAAFKKYDVLLPGDRKAVVDKAMQVVHALTVSASAQSARKPISASSPGGASSAGNRLQQTTAQNSSKVSNLKNLVGNGSEQGVPSGSVVSSSSSSGPHSEGLSVGLQLDDRQQKKMPEGGLSQRNRGIKLMAAEGSSTRAQLLTTADLAAACSEPKKEQSGMQAELSQRAAKHTGGSHPEAFSIGTNQSEAEQAQSRSAIAGLVGEDEEFSVGSGISQSPQLLSKMCVPACNGPVSFHSILRILLTELLDAAIMMRWLCCTINAMSVQKAMKSCKENPQAMS